MKKALVWIIIAIVTLVALTACSSGSGSKTNSTSSGNSVTYKDGTYTAQSAKNDRGQYGDITITVQGGKITKVDYKEINSDGKPKAKENGYTYEEALNAINDALPKQLLDKQDPNKIDTISKATGTSQMFIEAAKKALENAK